VKRPPSRSDNVPRRQVREADQERKPLIKTKLARFDTFVARYYCSIYSFALRVTDDPLEAVLLTHRAFNSVRKQLRSFRHEALIVIMVLTSVIRAGLPPIERRLPLYSRRASSVSTPIGQSLFPPNRRLRMFKRSKQFCE
jgi:hypothetical protein